MNAPALPVDYTPALPFDYTIVRSARRQSTCIEIRQAQVILRAPPRVSEAQLLAFMRSKRDWIEQKLSEQTAALAQRPAAPEWDTDSRLVVLGEPLRLLVQTGSFNAVTRHGDSLLMVINARGARSRQDKIRALLGKWLSAQALHILSAKTQLQAARIGRSVSAVTVKATKSKWGHCTRGGAIQYNWQILLAPEAVVDYLVAHEVSHLIHLNHSPEFWAQVAQLCPDFRALRLWLKQQGAQLVL